MHSVRATLCCCLLVLCLIPALPGFAQLEAYAVTHPFALPGSTTTRLQAMGGIVTCVPDSGFPNPAFAGLVTDWQATARHSVTAFEGGLNLNVEQASVAGPISRGRSGFQVTGLRLTADAGPGVAAPGAPVFDVGEWSIGLHYGHRVSDRLSLGLGMSPNHHNRVMVPGPSPSMPALQARANSTQGFRFGAVYQACARAKLGLVYDRYDEDVSAGGLALGGTVIETQTSSEAILAGLSYEIRPGMIAAAEWFQMTSDIADRTVGDSGWRLGLESWINEDVFVGLGTNDGSFSAGVGVQKGAFSVRYAHLDDWNDDFVGSIWGDSDTDQVEVTYHW